MEIKVTQGAAFQQKTACLVLGAFEGEGLAFLGQAPAFNKIFQRALTAKEFTAAKGQSFFTHAAADGDVERLLVVGLGKRDGFSAVALRRAVSEAAGLLAQKQLDEFVLSLPQGLSGPAGDWIQAAAEGLLLADYRYEAYLPSDRPGRAASLAQVILLVEEETVADAQEAVCRAEAISSAVCLARDLVNAPGNLKSPEYLASQAQQMAKQFGIKSTLLGRAELEAQGFGGLLGVAQGSQRDPYLIVLEYQGSTVGDRPVALVGKGVVFDSGGISLKPSEKMDEMKMDMGGAAAVIGTLQAAAALKLPVNLVGVVPAVENMPSGTAIRPGDILTSLSGKTIEVLNTDAEGRLILADALTYVEKYNPQTVIDLATLTGACIIALGNQAAAVLGNDDALAAALIAAGIQSGERVWQLPLWEEYSEQIKSDFADVKNTGGRPAGTITAAAFLKKFADQYRWAHLDIAGTAWADSAKAGQPKGGTGFGVQLLVKFLQNL